LARAASFDPPRTEPPTTPAPANGQGPSFLNVDLDISSRSPLDDLVKAFGRRIVTLHVGRDGRRYIAHLELATADTNPDRLIRSFVALVRKLPRQSRRVWDRAEHREFNLGIQASADNYVLRLARDTVRAAASVNAAIGVSVYGVRR
jgi:hypothetical protein